MVLNFKARNFFCFKEGVEVSFELNDKVPREIRKDGVARMMCVKGANASGKTNLMKIPSFLGWFCTHSFITKPEDDILVDSHFLSEDPILVEIEFLVKKVQYRYEIEIGHKKDKNFVKREALYRKKNRYTEIFERKLNKLSVIKECDSLKHMKLRSNASVISTSHNHNIDCLKAIYDFFSKIIYNVSYSGHVETNIKDHDVISNYCKAIITNPELKTFIIEFLKKADTGITDIQISQDKIDKRFFPVYHHGENVLLFGDQSTGTKMLFCQLVNYWFCIKRGGLYCVDEFDGYIHPHILPLILKMFRDAKTGAQLLFSTHHTRILKYMTKYRTILVKKRNYECFAYRMDEISQIRNDRDIVSIYDSGWAGGVPELEESYDELLTNV